MTTQQERENSQLTVQILEQIDKAKEQGKTVKDFIEEIKREQVLEMIFKIVKDKQ